MEISARAMVTVLWLLLLPTVSEAASLPVFDAGLNTLGLTEQWNQLKQLYEPVRQTANQIQQIENQVRQIEGMYTTIEQGAKNLARLNVTNAADLLGMLSVLESKLAQAQFLGYQAQHAVHQARGLYPRIQGLLTAEQQRTLMLHWAAVQRDSAHVAISTQAIREAQSRTQAQWTALLAQATAAEGALQVQQVTMQAQGVIRHQLLAIEQQLATQAREQSMRALEEASRIELEQTRMERALQPLDTTYTPQGRLLRGIRTGRE
jgi:P-type conjugative transfer protein TrbJ